LVGGTKMVGCGAILGVGGAGFSFFTFLNKKRESILPIHPRIG
jgi:hypothetical protein